jgi:2-methylcitrate dehydratase PrpD
MPKAIIKFDLNEESNDFKLAVNAKEIMSVLWEVDQELRNKIKYPSETTSQETIDALISIREFLRESMSDNNINFDMYS